MKGKQIAVWIFLFVLSYGLIYSLSNFVIQGYNWSFDSDTVSPMFTFMPLIGFASIVLLNKWAKKELDWNFIESKIFPIALIVFSILAFFFALYFFWTPQAKNITAGGGEFYTCPFFMEQDFGGESWNNREWNGVPLQGNTNLQMGFVESQGLCVWKDSVQCAALQYADGGQATQKNVCQMNFLSSFNSSIMVLFLLGGLAGWGAIKIFPLIEKTME